MHQRLGRTRAGTWGRLACAWALVFAALHFFWALGGGLVFGLAARASGRAGRTR
ncbi:hypothetical protein ACFWIA_24365 [Streptomyces sp. NPDC127068]|uniref:hypothetical protein n=1 Tax=Streptomyces sp. NPDC127068 TaxID=3347127 RepID=UPI00364BBA55